MNFKQQLAKCVTGNLTTDQLPDVGVTGLEEGLDTPSLCILAGLIKKESPYVIEHYFKLALEELEISLPDERQAAIEYAMVIVDEILEGKKDVIEGTREIYSNAIGSYDFFSENKDYCYDSIGFELVYGLYVTYYDLEEADIPWQPDKSNQILMEETKIELLEELRNWKRKTLPNIV